MSIGKFIKIFLALVLVFILGWLIYSKFIKPRISKKEVEKIPDSKDSPSEAREDDKFIENISGGGDSNKDFKNVVNDIDDASTSSAHHPTFKSPSTDELTNTAKWRDFNISKKLNRAKINNDIAISESNKTDNPDFEEIFSKPCEKDDRLFTPDTISSKVNINECRQIDYSEYEQSDTYNTVSEIDLNKLDDVKDFQHRFRDITTSIESLPDDLPKITLIDNEVFGW